MPTLIAGSAMSLGRGLPPVCYIKPDHTLRAGYGYLNSRVRRFTSVAETMSYEVEIGQSTNLTGYLEYWHRPINLAERH